MLSTRVIGTAIAEAVRPPTLWINAEATGELGGDEVGAPSTWRFSTDVARAWEAAFADAKTPRTRKVATRSAIVMIPGVSWLGKLTGLMRWGLAGTEGPGNQYMSWIHQNDFVGAIEFLIARADIEGPVNVCSPHPLPNREFLNALRRAHGARFAPPLPEWTLRLGSILLRTEAELVLKSRRVIPGRLLDAGFRFEYPDWPAAVRDLTRRGRASAENQKQYRPDTQAHGES